MWSTWITCIPLTISIKCNCKIGGWDVRLQGIAKVLHIQIRTTMALLKRSKHEAWCLKITILKVCLGHTIKLSQHYHNFVYIAEYYFLPPSVFRPRRSHIGFMSQQSVGEYRSLQSNRYDSVCQTTGYR